MIPIYWLGFILYAVFVVYLGWRSYRSNQPASEVDVDFWAAGKSLGPWATGLSISASFMSVSWSCVYAVQYTNKKARPKTGSVFLKKSQLYYFTVQLSPKKGP